MARVRFLPAPPDGMRGPRGCYGPSSYCATAVWLPILGPSTFLAWRLLACELRHHPGGDDLVFARPDGTPTHPEVLRRTFDRIVTRTGLPRIRLHDVRHTHASLLLKAGVPVEVVSERLGHATASFTLDVYS